MEIGDGFILYGKEVSIYSVALDRFGNAYIAVLSTDEMVEIYSLPAGAAAFRKVGSIPSVSTSVAPRIFAKSDGTLIMYISRETVISELGDSIELFFTLSSNGTVWSEPVPLVNEQDKKLNFLPYHLSAAGTEYVAFQVLETGERPSYQIYLKTSSDGGRTWTPPRLLTGFGEEVGGIEQESTMINNQRPYLYPAEGRIILAWERTPRFSNTQIYSMDLDYSGNIISDPERISGGIWNSSFPRIFTYQQEEYYLWFDDRAGDEHIILANRRGISWDEKDISSLGGISTFARVVMENGRPYLFWENRLQNRSRIVYLAPDTTVISPEPRGGNFVPGRRYRQDTYTATWSLPPDSSGIAGFSFSWDRDSAGSPPRRIRALQRDRLAEFEPDEDGYWYFHVSAADYAGNWSEPGTISFYLDTTPPERVTFDELQTDEDGFAASNTFTLTWKPPEDDPYIAGYSYRIEFLGNLGYEVDPGNIDVPQPPMNLQTPDNELFFRNWDNGNWIFSVRPFDSVGNPGEAEAIIFTLNKYVPETFITTVAADTDLLGTVTLTLRGRGFSVGGDVTSVFLDRDGVEPYDYEYPLDAGLFTVVNDRLIDDLRIENVDEGVYRVGVRHPLRGIYFTGPELSLESGGAIKFGDFRQLVKRTFVPVRESLVKLTVNETLFFIVLGLLAAGLIFAVFRIFAVVREGRTLEKEVRSIITQQDLTERQKRERLAQMKKKGMGLRIKFTLFITMLIIMVVAMVSIALAYITINTQRRNLSTGLQQQTEVLLESLTSSARTYLPARNTLELGLIPAQRSAMEDSLFVTITGSAEGDAENYNYVWASDDPGVSGKIDTATLSSGVSRIDDDILPEAQDLKEQINNDAREALGDITQQLDQLAARAREIALSEEAGAAEQLAEYQREISDLEQSVNEKLKELGNITRSVPAFDIENMDDTNTDYVFFKPIVYRTIGQDDYYKGLVRLGVSTERILKEIKDSVRQLVFIIGIIAIVAVIIGIVGAIVFSAIMIIPIRRLVQGVERIRDTSDKEELKGHEIVVRTKDEISELADTVNQMTMGLVAAAMANKELMVGRDIQRKFLPLDTNKRGEKGTTAKKDSERFNLFGYYEGASGVSGDYFDFKQLDDKHYAVIKCDVSGHGVSAALIMVRVATIFSDYFRDWSLRETGFHLEDLVYNINDQLVELEFKGMFAALIISIINMETGECYICHAGDNIFYVFEKATGILRRNEMAETPATGAFDTDLVKMQSGYKQVKYQLNPGNILFLFTDGIDEAQRYLRNENFDVIVCEEPGLEPDEFHGRYKSHRKFNPQEEESGYRREELTIGRITEILEAFFSKGTFTLEKYHNPLPDETLTFDYSDCEDSIEDAILAIMAAEKIFRLVPDPEADATNRITVDRKINNFLKNHFDQYSYYFSNQVRSSDEEEGDYVYFTHMKEDPQEDDLTMLAIQRK